MFVSFADGTYWTVQFLQVMVKNLINKTNNNYFFKCQKQNVLADEKIHKWSETWEVGSVVTQKEHKWEEFSITLGKLFTTFILYKSFISSP